MITSNSCILAIDAGGTSLKAALVKNDAIIQGSFFSIPVDSTGHREDILCAYESLGNIAQKFAFQNHLEIVACSVCIPGPFDYANGCCMMKHKYQSVFGISLRPSIQSGLHNRIPIVFLHDSSAFLLGAWKPTISGPQRVCGVIIGTGLGFATMINGRILTNEQGGPYISIFANSYMGRTAEDYVSKRGITDRYFADENLADSILTVKDIADMAHAGDSKAIKTFEDTGIHLASILRPIIIKNKFEVLILGGAIAKSSDLFISSLDKALNIHPLMIKPADDIDIAPIIGASRYINML